MHHTFRSRGGENLAAAPKKNMKPNRILIVDDERIVCDGCRLCLSEEGYAVDIRQTGGAGMDAALTGTYDVILLDMKLPDLDGMQILETFQKQGLSALVIVMTGFSSVQNAVQAMKLGAFDYLSKPFSDDELFMAVQKAVEHKRLREDNQALRRQLFQRYDFNNIIGETPRILEIFEAIRKVAPTDSTVLLCGESGTGKELFAGAIHAHSRRASRPFVAADCSTFSPGLLESELFGHVKGAFTGALHDRQGIFDAAAGGTLFLDEVANLSLDIQGKLLRVMENGEFKPVGASRLKTADVRVIAATNRNLKKRVAAGAFREDLYYRLNVFPIFLPPLRERKDDIPRLAYHYLKSFCRKTGKKVEGFTDSALQTLVDYEWPGNVRQLKNVVERLVIMADDEVVNQAFVRHHLEMRRDPSSGGIPTSLKELKAVKKRLIEEQYGRIEKAFLQQALSAEGGNITRAARRVGMQRSNFSARMKKHGLTTASTLSPARRG